tara:strand:+ start:269 stop:892 length:624 start_codon:yes stop_codon:yes gene_type:complete
MIIHKNGKKKIFFIHIPRNAGRYVRQLFLKNKYEISYDNYSKEHSKCGIEEAHLHYPLYDLLPVKNLPVFTIIRNPFNRIKKSLAQQLISDETQLEFPLKEEHFYNYIEDHRKYASYHNNWYRPQYEFLSSNTRLWKFDWGFKEPFCDWLNVTFDLNIVLEKINLDYDRFPLDNLSIPSHIEKYLEDFKPFVKKYYYQDYELWSRIK